MKLYDENGKQILCPKDGDVGYTDRLGYGAKHYYRDGGWHSEGCVWMLF